MSVHYPPAMDGQRKRTAQTLEDMLWACMLDFRVRWEYDLNFIEFSYDNSYYASINMTPFDALYGRKCHSSLCWSYIRKKIMFEIVVIKEMKRKIRLI